MIQGWTRHVVRGFSQAWLPLVALFVAVITWRAWMGDDAFITMRTVDNFVNGHGLRWNVAERVQAFTHPLWLFVLALPYAVTREAWLTTLLTSVVVSAIAAAMGTRVAEGRAAGAAVFLVAAISSRSIADYSTSGLENPLSHLLLTLLALEAWRAQPRALHLGLLLSALALTRLDLLVLAGPMTLGALMRTADPQRSGKIVLGLAPLVAWEIFSVIYYGVPFPNTAYAKLATGIPKTELAAQGAIYLLDSIGHDPATWAILLLAPGLVWATGTHGVWPAALGVLLSLAYVVSVGGDFMSGRFLSAPTWLSALMLARLQWHTPSLALAAAATVTVFSFAGPDAPARFQRPPITGRGHVAASGIADERYYYARGTGLWSARGWRTEPAWGDLPQKIERFRREGRRIVLSDAIGMMGYLGGPDIHFVDVMALSDPLLARQPAARPWRVGHYRRRVPEGYVESLEQGRNLIADPEIAETWNRLLLITQAPVWSWQRWRAIAALNFGRQR